MFVVALIITFLSDMQNLTFSGRVCDHMIYDGACDCYERPDPSFDFYAELAAINQEQEQENPQVVEHLEDERLLDIAEHQRLLDYLAEDNEVTETNEATEFDEYEPYEDGHRSPIQSDDYYHYSPPASPYYEY